MRAAIGSDCTVQARVAVAARGSADAIARIAAAAAPRPGAFRRSYGGVAAGQQIQAEAVARCRWCRARPGCGSRRCSGPEASAGEDSRKSGKQFMASVIGTHSRLRADRWADRPTACPRSHGACSRGFFLTLMLAAMLCVACRSDCAQRSSGGSPRANVPAISYQASHRAD